MYIYDVDVIFLVLVKIGVEYYVLSIKLVWIEV